MSRRGERLLALDRAVRAGDCSAHGVPTGSGPVAPTLGIASSFRSGHSLIDGHLSGGRQESSDGMVSLANLSHSL